MVRQVLLSGCLIAATVCEARPVPCRRAVKAVGPEGYAYDSHFATNVFGQFFPSTPAIPGGFAHKLAGEYDMPPAGLALWAFAEAAR